ncbi:MBL fold metallo-hydrolase [Candidatus Bathyarchaeota archaeon]|nr:MBL fold metallo-hydrolase [Candidatus Bathyarchaeota archaeon]
MGDLEIIEGVRCVSLSSADGLDLKVYLLDCLEGLILFDTGYMPEDIEAIGREIKALGRDWRDIRLILLTHRHGDHIGNLARLKELTGADVASGEGEMRDIEAETGVKVDKGLRHGDYIGLCGGVEAIHVPGHTVGNLSFYLFRQKAIIAGDTIFGDDHGNLYPPPEKYSVDAEIARKELKRLLFYDFDILLLSHGRNLLGDAKRRVRMLCEET